MKKIIILTLLLVSTTMFSQAKVQPGLRGGVNISEIKGVKGEQKTDFYLGATLSINLSSFYTIQPEITYTNQGGKNVYKRVSSYNNTTNQYEYRDTYEDFDLEYLSLGVTNKFFVTPNRDFCFLITPNWNFILDQNSGYNLGNNGYLTESKNITEVDLAISLGMGYESPFGLGIEARYKLGVVNVLDGVFSGTDTRNRVFQVGLTYKFLSKKRKNKKNNTDEK